LYNFKKDIKKNNKIIKMKKAIITGVTGQDGYFIEQI
jgi:hypothetical protein